MRAAWLAEYEAARAGAAAVRLEGWSLYRFAGPDLKPVLNGLLTQDLNALKDGGCLPACLLTPKGKLLARADLFARGGEVFAAIEEPAAAANFSKALGQRLILSETKMENVSQAFGLVRATGPAAAELEGKARFSAPAFSDGADRLWLLPVEEAELAFQALLNLGAAALGPEAREALRVEDGRPRYGQDMGPDTIPLEARLDAAVADAKGCYMGQETISRIRNLGHINRILAGLKLDGEASAPAPVLAEGKEVGRATSVAFSPRLGAPLALATIAVSSSAPGSRLTVGAAGAIVVEIGRA